MNLDLLLDNLTNPALLFFLLGIIATGNAVLDIGAGVNHPLRKFIKGSNQYFSLDIDPEGSFDYRSIADIPEGNPISIENLKVHFCEKGNGYVISDRKFLMEASEGALIKKQMDIE